MMSSYNGVLINNSYKVDVCCSGVAGVRVVRGRGGGRRGGGAGARAAAGGAPRAAPPRAAARLEVPRLLH